MYIGTCGRRKAAAKEDKVEWKWKTKVMRDGVEINAEAIDQ